MRRLVFGIGLSVAALGVAQPAAAGVLFDTLTGLAGVGRTRMIAPGFPSTVNGPSPTVANGGPLAVSFYAPYATDLASVMLRLRVTTPNDGGSVMVYLAQNTGGGVNDPGAPVTAGSGMGLTFGTGSNMLLGSVDYSGFTAATDTDIAVSMLGQVHITAGQYWLGLVNAVGSTTGTARWSNESNFTAGIGATFQENYAQFPGPVSWGDGDANPGNGAATGLFQAQIIDTPEPATLAVVGAGLAALGLIRRRRRA